MESGSSKDRKLHDIKIEAEKLGAGMCKALPGFHAFTGCDTTSAFSFKGKIKPYKILLKDKSALEACAELGTNEVATAVLVQKLENFACRIYGDKGKGDRSINHLRCCQFQSRSKTYASRKTKQTPTQHRSKDNVLDEQNQIDISSLPPVKESLILHINRANFQTRIWRKADQAGN